MLAPPDSSKSPQDGPKPGQDGPRSAQDGSKTVLKSVFSLLKIDFDLTRFGDDFGCILAPQMPPFDILLALKIDQKINQKSDCLKGRSKIAPRAPKTL